MAAAAGRRFYVHVFQASQNMANRNGLRLIGWAYGGVTAIIAVIALVVVTAHVNTAIEAHPGTAVLSAR